MKNLISIIFILLSASVIAQTGVIEGRIIQKKNNQSVEFANVAVWNTSVGTVTDLDGKFRIEKVPLGYVELRVSAIGYKTYISEDILVTRANKVFLEIQLEESSIELEEVKISASPFRKREESPVSLRTLGIAEIEKNPGGNRDVSRVIQTLPGVSSSVAYRNDVIVRGGGASENRFYLDGVEIPNLNHFSTQGASGGPVGIINIDFIRELNFYSGAFPSNRGNALSSVLEFSQVDGNKEKLKTRAAVGASDMSLALDGPLGDKTSFVFSLRRSYLQYLFSVIGLPFLPTYNDFQFKTKTKFNEKNELTILGLGALDLFDLNTKENETQEQQYILSYLPVNEQYSYTLGAVFKHYRENSYDTWVLSRNFLNNTSYKHSDNNESLPKTFDYKSDEAEWKFRYENTARYDNGLKLNWGVNLEQGSYFNQTYNLVYINGTASDVNYKSNLDIWKWGAFSQASKSFFDERLSLSLGVRADANNYDENMKKIWEQFSPRFSASYRLAGKWWLNANAGTYYQLPAYTSLGYRNNASVLVNQENNLKYIKSNHLVAGVEWLPNEHSKVSVEGFFKNYSQYPFSVNDSVALASKGADYGTVGDEELKSIGKGRSYGLEILSRNRNFKGYNIIMSYTLVRSEFKDYKNEYIPTSWDNKHIFNLTVSKQFKNNWDLGFKWRYVGGSPYTPYDLDYSSKISAWDARGREYLDYSRYNSERLGAYHQLDLRIDKQFYFRNFSLMMYLDIQNLYNFAGDTPDNYLPATDASGNYLINPSDPSRYVLQKIEREGGGTVLPTIGVIVEF